LSAGALVRFDDRRAARDRKAATRRLGAPLHQAGAVPVSMGLATLVLAAGKSFFCTQRLTVLQNFGTYRIVKEICNAARELARFPAPFSSILPDLFIAGDGTHEIHSLAPGVATSDDRFMPRFMLAHHHAGAVGPISERRDDGAVEGLN
jgi:hypothetical protein